MEVTTNTCLVYVTTPNKQVAEEIAQSLVRDKLVACANIFPEIKSVYEWQGKIENSSEYVLLLKTRSNLFVEIEKQVLKLHAYDCPCIVGLPITEGHQDFLDWIGRQTSSKRYGAASCD